MKKLTGWIAALVAVMMLAGVAVAEENTSGTLGNWFGSAATSVETWLRESGELEVRGQAVVTVVPDTAAVEVGAAILRDDEREAQQEANRIIGEVIEAIKALGVQESQIMTSGYNVSRQYDYSQTPAVATGYLASITLRVTVKDFALINSILDTAVSLGANEVGGLSFSYSKEDEAYHEALENAIRAARAKAERMADAAGVELYTLLALREGSNAVPAYYNSMAKADMAGGGAAQVMAGELEISATVTMLYQIK